MADISTLGRVETILFLLTIATVAAVLLKKWRIPYTIGLVPVGIVIAALLDQIPALQPFRNVQLGQELIMYVLLPALIFDASINIDVKLLKRNLWPTLMLAGPGLVIATLVTGGLMHWLTGLSLGASMVFGALISATDPVAVISLFELVGAPRRLRILVDGESLFNDATAIAMYNVVAKLVFVAAGKTVVFGWGTIGSGAWEFCAAFLGGLLVGGFFGLIMTYIMVWAGDDPHIKVVLSILLAYASFIVADRVFHFSGVMSVMGAGMVISYFGQTKFNELIKEYMRSFWAFMSFLANSAIFLLLGFTETHILFDMKHGATLKMVVIAILAIQIARILVVFGFCPFLGRGKNKISLAYQVVMFWGGLRGAVPLALVFSIPANYAERGQIMQITLAVVLFTLLVQGLTTRRLLNFFKLDQPGAFSRLAEWFTMLNARRAGLKRIGETEAIQTFDPAIIGRLETEYQQKVEAVSQYLDFNDPENRQAAIRLIWSKVIAHERSTVDRYLFSGLLSEDACRRLIVFNGFLIGDLDAERAPDTKTDAERLYRLSHRPGNRLLAQPWFRKRFRHRAFLIMRDSFSTLITLLVAARDAQKVLDSELEQLAGNTGAVETCRNFFEARATLLQEALLKLGELDQELYRKAQEYSLRYLIFDTELHTIETAYRAGAVDDVEFDTLTEFIKGHQRQSLLTISQ